MNKKKKRESNKRYRDNMSDEQKQKLKIIKKIIKKISYGKKVK